METEKKRNHVLNGEDDHKEQEDEKMEQFFALVRNFRQACNRRKHELRSQRDLEEEMISKKMKISNLGDDHKKSSWVPSFEWEEFTTEIEFRRPLIVFPNSYNKKEYKKNHEEDDGLDLNKKNHEENDGLDLNLTLSQASA